MNVIEDIKRLIFEPLFNKKLVKALQFFARAFARHCEDKNFATYIGNRDCGKGILYEIFKAFGDYLQPLVLDNILCSRNSQKEPKRSVDMFWLLDLEFCRLAFSQETPELNSGLKINPTLFKKLVSGGDTQKARRNYDREDTSFQVDFTPFMAGNNSLALDGDVAEHLIEFESIVRFLSPEEIDGRRRVEGDEIVETKYRLKDPSLKDKCHSIEWKKAVIYLLYINYTDAALQAGVVSDEGEPDTSLLGQFLADFEITRNEEDMVLVSEIKTLDYGKDRKKLKTELEGMELVIKKSKCNIYRDKLVVVGIKMIPVDSGADIITEIY